jgi:protein-disulfide isomerase
MSGNTPRSKNERREHARETARQRQEEERRRKRRNRLLTQGGLGAVVLAAIVIVILVIVHSSSSSPTTAAEAGPRNMATNGIVFHGVAGKVEAEQTGAVPAKGTPKPVSMTGAAGSSKLTLYIDWTCPACKQFEASYSAKILALVAQGKVTLEIHPIAILDSHYQSSKYSSRAANAAACVANSRPDRFLAVQQQFYDHQPEEGTAGLTNAQIKALVRAGGVSDATVASCIDSDTYGPWVTAATNLATSDSALVDSATGSFSTPTVLLNGARWDGTTDLLQAIDRD